MRKCLLLLLTICLLLILPLQAGAVGAEQVNIQATVSPDGTAQVVQSVTLLLDRATDDLRYPIPENATAVTLNGSRVTTGISDNARTVDLSRIAGKVAGNVTFTIGYRLSGLVNTTEDGLLQLELPLLSGFAYSVDTMEFTVTMPMEVTVKPAFTSGYHQSNIESSLIFSYSGTTITGSSKNQLKDHETLAMTLMVTEDVFPQQVVELPTLDAVVIAMGVIAALALIYWLIWLRNGPVRRQKDTTAPAGCTAGHLGSVLSMEGPELPMMVLSWAQRGYVLLFFDNFRQLTIHKIMEMGNERSSFERRIFATLFAKRNAVDTSTRQWALLCRKVRKNSANVQSFLHSRSGNPLVFRGICAVVGLLGGVCLGLMLGNGAALQWFVVLLFGALGLIWSWHVQAWAYALFSYRRQRLWLALVLCGVYLIFSAIAGLMSQGIWVCLCQLMCGLMSAFGGRRTESGKQAMAQTMGLRRYLRTLPKSEVERICEKDPEFFHNMIPEALALGAGKAFAKRFGWAKQPPCPYLTTGRDGHRTTAEWLELMCQAVDAMYLREQKLLSDRIMNIIYSFTR